MNAQLMRVQRELQESDARLRQLLERLPGGTWAKRPDWGGWSVGHCVIHLNRTTEGSLPRLDAAIREGWQHEIRGPGPFRRDFVGWLLCRLVEPPYRIKVKTPTKFDPEGVASEEEAMQDWERLQRELDRRIATADGLALNRVRVVSPFVEKMKYNLLSALMVIPAHQRRHVWQAEQIVKSFS